MKCKEDVDLQVKRKQDCYNASKKSKYGKDLPMETAKRNTVWSRSKNGTIQECEHSNTAMRVFQKTWNASANKDPVEKLFSRSLSCHGVRNGSFLLLHHLAEKSHLVTYLRKRLPIDSL